MPRSPQGEVGMGCSHPGVAVSDHLIILCDSEFGEDALQLVNLSKVPIPSYVERPW